MVEAMSRRIFNRRLAYCWGKASASNVACLLMPLHNTCFLNGVSTLDILNGMNELPRKDLQCLNSQIVNENCNFL